MPSRFVRPETTVLTLANGDTLIVKKRLTHGERTASYARQYIANAEGTLVFQPAQVKLSMVTAYLLDWSLVGLDEQQVVIRDQPIEVVEAALNNLPPEDFDEILTAITKHEKAMIAERKAALKKTDSASDRTSTLPSAAGGRSETSVN